MDIESLKYPIGKYQLTETITDDQFTGWITTIRKFPEELKGLVVSLSYDELELQYRPDGWNIKQVVHHLADSHMNSFLRFKWILTEDNPTIKTYHEDLWAEKPDANNEEIVNSLEILEGLHNRWALLLENVDAMDRKRTFYHPEYDKQLSLEWLLGLYDWHCRHHLAHIKQAIEKDGEFID